MTTPIRGSAATATAPAPTNNTSTGPGPLSSSNNNNTTAASSPKVKAKPSNGLGEPPSIMTPKSAAEKQKQLELSKQKLAPTSQNNDSSNSITNNHHPQEQQPPNPSSSKPNGGPSVIKEPAAEVPPPSTATATAPSSNKKPWHSDPQADVEARRIVIQQIVALLESCKPKAFANRQEKLIDLARRLEVALYKQSKTKADYMNKETLRHRVRELAKASTGPSSSSSSVNTSGDATKATNPQRRSSTTAGGAASTLSEDEQRQQILKQRQQRLLLLRHASRCNAAPNTCKVTPHCQPMKQLWQHIAKCKDQRCTVPHCVSSRYVLSHYHRCKSESCPVCKPVRIISQTQRLQQQRLQQGMGGTRSRSQQQLSASIRAQAIDPRYARACVSGTGPSLPFSMKRETVDDHVKALRVERLQMAVTPLLRKLMENKNNKGIYNEPVDHVALNIPDYPRVITRPMDLGTIRKQLDACHYKTLQQFQEDVMLVFNNAKTFNPPENDYHVRAVNLLKICENDFPKIHNKMQKDGRRRAGDNCPLCFQQECEICPLCERGCIAFVPKVLFCSGPCAQRISRNANYYTGVGQSYCWCSDCYDKSKGDSLTVNNQYFRKTDLLKRKNNELYGEPWVSCDTCNRWCHQVCALFNSRKNNPNSVQPYTCPMCLVKDSKVGEVERARYYKKEGISNPPPPNQEDGTAKQRFRHLALPAGKKVPSAEDLDHSRLGIFLEMWLRDRISAYQMEHLKEGERGPDASKLHVRVLSNFDEKCKVKPFVKKLLPEYPDHFTFRSRCIFLYQELDGVDVLFFAMFVQEYGSDCPEPNRRKVYIAYLDSVYYFRPRQMRTMVYHELLLAYLEYSRRNGFTSAYIWACPPPNKRDDYIIHCHPEDQRVQTADRLRKWYHEMIRCGTRENICLGSSSLFEEHFEASARKKKPGKKKRGGKAKAKTKTKGVKGTKKGVKGRSAASVVAGAAVANNATTAASSSSSSSSATAAMDVDQSDLLQDLPDMGDADEDEDLDATLEDANNPANAKAAAAAVATPSFPGNADLYAPVGNGLLTSDGKNLHDDLAQRKLAKLAANGRLPYFEGDYWPQEAEELAKERQLKKKKEANSKDDKVRNKRKKRGREEDSSAAKPDAAAGSADLTDEEAAKARQQLMQRLSEQLDAMKDDFLVVKMAHECTRCGIYLLRGRWECRNKECSSCDFDKSPPFALCNGCYIKECKRPVEQQHGGGCILQGPEGEPKNVEEEEKKNKGLDQVRICVNQKEKEEQKKEEKEKEEKEKEEKEKEEKEKKKAKTNDAPASGTTVKKEEEDTKPQVAATTGSKETEEKDKMEVDTKEGEGEGEGTDETAPSRRMTRASSPRLSKNKRTAEAKSPAPNPPKRAKPTPSRSTRSSSNDSATKPAPKSTPKPPAPKTAPPTSTSVNKPKTGPVSSKPKQQEPPAEETKTSSTSTEMKVKDEAPAAPPVPKPASATTAPAEGTSGSTTTAATVTLKKEPQASSSSTSKSATAAETAAAAKKKTEEEEKKAEEEKRKNMIEWRKQPIRCSRIVVHGQETPTTNGAADTATTENGESNGGPHFLHYVDENLPVETPDYDKIRTNHLLQTRHAFLSLCTGNRYQFDQLRRAKHATMMVLYHLHNPDAPAHLYTCSECSQDIISGKRYNCNLCSSGDYNVCRQCKMTKPHKHTLTPFIVTRGVNAETSEAQRMQRVTEMRRARKHSLALFLQALLHSSSCADPGCQKPACQKMKELLDHRLKCSIRVRGGCEICRRVLCLVQMHSRQCKTKNCLVPHCQDLKQHIRNQLEQQRLRLKRQQQQLQQQQMELNKQRRGGRGTKLKTLTSKIVPGSGGTRLKIRPRGRGRGKKN